MQLHSRAEPSPFDTDDEARRDARHGSRLRRVSTATALGFVAALGGSVLYFAVAALTQREFGLVAVVVGFMVGKAVRRGARGRGGWVYQTLAISLTYLAIVSTYVPRVARAVQQMPAPSGKMGAGPVPDTLGVAAPNEAVRSAIGSGLPPAHDTGFSVEQAGAPVAAPETVRPRPPLGIGTLVVGVGALLLLAAIDPFAAGLSNIVGLVIIGLAVFVAWYLNRRVAPPVDDPGELTCADDEASAAA